MSLSPQKPVWLLFRLFSDDATIPSSAYWHYEVYTPLEGEPEIPHPDRYRGTLNGKEWVGKAFYVDPNNEPPFFLPLNLDYTDATSTETTEK
jgi:hypothetical protein